MTRKAQLSFAELIERGVPLSASEAVALTLAAWDSGVAIPGDTEVLLSSTGQVTCGVGQPPRDDDPFRLAGLLHRLLRLDEVDAGERRGRVPGALLVVLARTMRQIDLPPLSRDAFHDALTRFTSPEPALLAAVFWRAARMRPRRGNRLAPARATAHTRNERRAQGPNPAELRRWLRQTESELFQLRQSRAGSAGMAAAAALAVVAILSIGASLGERTPDLTSSGLLSPDADAASSVTAPPVTAVAPAGGATPALSMISRDTPLPVPAKKPSPSRPRSAQASTNPPIRTTAEPTARAPRPRTLDMVNLPRAPWAVVRHLDSAAAR